ncbi:MAG: hypothetical protein ACI8S6_005973 [Myxococcota bacterium]|jgi:uncharacterized protein (DUF1501 family)
MSFSRRNLLRNAAAMSALGAVGWHPSMARAAVGERKFIFFYAMGGWDTTAVFDPHHGSSMVDMEQDTLTSTLGNMAFTGGDPRLFTSRFFQRWGNKAAIINGIDAHSVGHESGRQFAMTGTFASSYPDWPTLLAARGQGDYPLPHVVFSGPNYSGNEGSAVVRAGGGALLDLIDGSIVGASDRPAPLPASPADSIVDAFVYDRVANFAGARGGRAESLISNLDRAMEIEGRRFEAGLSDLGSSMLEQSIKASEMMRLGLSRCAMVGIPGGWDSHGDNMVQGLQFEDFFDALDQLMDHLATTPGLSSPWLIDEVVVVALSEFGRTPMLNGSGGKDHWPYNSALVVGSGVQGNRMIGKTDDSLVAEPINFQTGLRSDTGEMLGAEHLGAALLKLGGIDPESHLPGVQSLDALLKG